MAPSGTPTSWVFLSDGYCVTDGLPYERSEPLGLTPNAILSSPQRYGWPFQNGRSVSIALVVSRKRRATVCVPYTGSHTTPTFVESTAIEGWMCMQAATPLETFSPLETHRTG